MNGFDNDLRQALRRCDPPDGFADRVMARIPVRKRHTWWAPRSAAAAALIVVLGGAGAWQFEHSRQKRLEAERAKAELVQGLELTSAKLQATRSRLLRHLGGRLI
jgi:hypothetical protein